MRTRWAPVATAAAAIAAAAVARPALEPLELQVEGLWALRPPAAPPGPVVVIAIDDATLERLPDPMVLWGPAFASAIERLREAGASAIGLDVVLAASAEEFFARHGLGDGASRTWDAPLRQAVHGGRVVLVATERLRPARDLELVGRGPHGVALGTLEARSGVVTGFAPVPAPAAEDAGWSFALALAELHAGSVPAAPAHVDIAWAGPPGTVPSLPLWSVLDGLDASEQAQVAGRVAVVGTTHALAQDRVRTVHTRWLGATMAAPEVHANAVAALLTGRRLIRLDRVSGTLWDAAFGVGATLAFFRLPLTGASLAAAGLALLAAAASFAGSRLDVALPLVAPLLATGTAFGAAFALRFAREVRERRHVRDLFGTFLAREVADWVLSQPGARPLGGAERVATVLFCDVRGFTTLSERLSPAETVEVINAWFARAGPAIVARGGILDKYLGDGFVAVFGAPIPRPDHAARAVAAARAVSAEVPAMRRWLEERFRGRGLAPFEVGLGLHTGTVVAGTIGFPGRLEYTTIGDATNVASRVEGLTKEAGCRILATEAAIAAAGDAARPYVGRRWELPVKGREARVGVLEIRAEEG